MGWLNLKDRVCVVTGAGGGIGRATALDLAREGAVLALIDLDEARCSDVLTEVRSLGARAEVFAADISDQAQVDRTAERCREALGACDVLINVPAISGRPDPLMSVAIEKWNRHIEVNINGYLHCSRAFGRQMIAQGRGSIVNVGSIAGELPQPESGAYSVTKAGVSMLSRGLALELGKNGVRSNVVSPAMIRTPLSERLYSNPDVARRRAEFVPLGRVGVAQDISNTILFLASDRSGYISGQTLLVDGGVSLVLMGLFPK